MAVTIDLTRCVGCGLCIEVCPTHALFYKKGQACYDINKCTLCGKCDRMCICSALTFEPAPGPAAG